VAVEPAVADAGGVHPAQQNHGEAAAHNQVLPRVIDRWPGKGQRNVKAKRPGQRLPEPPALGLQQRMIWSRCSGPRCPAARERRAQHDTCSRELPKRGRGGALRG
jgi:hypothetical protein